MEPTIVNCEKYNAIKFDRNNYELINDDNARFEYSTYRDTLVSSLKDTPYCYIGCEKGQLYCNRLRKDMKDINTIRDIEDFLMYGNVIPKHITQKFDNVPKGEKPKVLLSKKYCPNWEYRMTDDELYYLYHSMTTVDTSKWKTLNQQRKRKNRR